MMTDPIADMLTRLRNAQLSRREKIEMPYSKLKKAILDILQEEKYISGARVEEADGRKKILVDLRYDGRQPAIRSLKRESKPGRRVYCKKDNLPSVLNGYGIAILSTPNGLMTNKKAKEHGVGGELICSVY
ncbi:MAG: 30S ribosomal protein S8 [Candidatus Magasanikbacteria bacterium]|nr:30S ribosomal protein S8 [Candidatus Magasanikbacteria bacterium]